MSEFSNIEKYSGNRNMGGVWRKFRFIPVEEVSEIPFYEDDNIETEITLADGSGWFDGWAVLETIGFKEKPVGDAGNPTGYEVELPGEFAKDTPGLLTKVQRMEGRRFFVLAEDHNGNVCLLGNQQKDKDGVYKGIRFQSVRDSGTKVAERNGYAFSFKGQQPVRSPFYQAEIVSAPGSASVELRNSDDSYTETVTVSPFTLPDETLRVYVNGVLNQTVTYIPLSNEAINISP